MIVKYKTMDFFIISYVYQIYMNNKTKIFDLIKSNNTDIIAKYINDNTDEDFNIKDTNGIYFIYYVLTKNDTSLLKILLKANIRIDVYDPDGKSILHNPIKFGYDEIVDILLEYNKKAIGIPIQTMYDDNGYIPLHYAIIYQNTKCFNKLLDISDCSIVNKLGNNALMLSILYRSFDFMKSIYNKTKNLSIQNKSGESSLHIACKTSQTDIVKFLLSKKIDTNIQEYEMKAAALHYVCSIGNENIVGMLIDNDADVNIQDFDGNTPLHYSVMYDKIKITELLITHPKTKSRINLNLYNINLSLPLHIAFSNGGNNLQTYINLLLPNTNINFQNKLGNTCLHEICGRNIWIKNANILEHKKNDMLIRNNKNMRPIDYVNEKDKVTLIDKIALSYMNALLNNKKMWDDTWKKDCHNDLAKCYKDSRKKIENLINEDKYNCDDRTYPSNHISKKCIGVGVDERISFNTLVGSVLDIWSGCLYVLEKHPNVLVVLNNLDVNDTTKMTFYRKYGIPGSSSHEMLFENTFVTWYKHSIDFSSHGRQLFVNLLNDVKQNNKKNALIVLCVTIIDVSGFRHANVLIYDHDKKELERFDPFGSGTYKMLDETLEKYFADIIPDVKYISPDVYMTSVGLQKIDVSETQNEYIGDPGGYCVAWSNWYVDMRASYPELERDKLIRCIIQQVSLKQIKFRSIIRNYSRNITVIRDDVLNKANIDINQFINNEFNEKHFDVIISEFNSRLQNLQNKNLSSHI